MVGLAIAAMDVVVLVTVLLEVVAHVLPAGRVSRMPVARLCVSSHSPRPVVLPLLLGEGGVVVVVVGGPLLAVRGGGVAPHPLIDAHLFDFSDFSSWRGPLTSGSGCPPPASPRPFCLGPL